jgi:GR25 family glycosyltransferase involved in LPS biosynthesis
MGVDVYVMDFLLRSKRTALGRTLWLGRQGFHMPREKNPEQERKHLQELAIEVVRQYAPDASYFELCGDTGYAEALFRFLGSDSISALDNSDFEGADLIHDLNTPIPSSLVGKFDCIFDGGTIEHIFDVPQTLENVHRMLAANGVFLSVNGANNFIGHGLYQFSPELMWRVFSREAGYEIETMYLMDDTGFPNPRSLVDPAKLGRRDQIRITSSRTYLMMAARKLSCLDHLPTVHQSDYAAAWRSFAISSGAPETGGPSADTQSVTTGRRAHSLTDSIGDIHVINLEGSPDRLVRFRETNPHVTKVVRFPAVDGSLIDREQLIKDGLILSDLAYGPGTLGCALSHVRLWQHCVSTNKPITIAEDDALIVFEFSDMVHELLSDIGKDWEMMLWGYNFEQCYMWVDYGFARARLWFYGLDTTPSRHLFLQSARSHPRAVRVAHSLGLFCYSIKPSSARALLARCVPLRKRNIDLPGTGVFLPDFGIDVAMAGAYPSMRVFASMPPLAFSDYHNSIRRLADNVR